MATEVIKYGSMKPRNQVKRYGPSHIERQKYGALTHYWPKDMMPFRSHSAFKGG